MAIGAEGDGKLNANVDIKVFNKEKKMKVNLREVALNGYKEGDYEIKYF